MGGRALEPHPPGLPTEWGEAPQAWERGHSPTTCWSMLMCWVEARLFLLITFSSIFPDQLPPPNPAPSVMLWVTWLCVTALEKFTTVWKIPAKKQGDLSGFQNLASGWYHRLPFIQRWSQALRHHTPIAGLNHSLRPWDPRSFFANGESPKDVLQKMHQVSFLRITGCFRRTI